MKEDIAIKVSGLGKKYTIGKEKDGSLRSTLSGVFKSSASKGDDFWALKDVNFEIKKGEVVGIIGKNGAGKSTLLKVLSQITKPTEGRIEINGRVASLLEVGTGFHPELTGRENIFLNGTILGMTRKEVKAKFDEIVEFSGVQKFIDTPVKHYSSGMYVRLAFAVAAHLEPEILIIDEVLAVGDAEFQKKCLGKMEDVAKEGRTVIFVSHDLGAVGALCKNGMLMQRGNIMHSGSIETCINNYTAMNLQEKKYIPSFLKSELDDYFKSVEIKPNKDKSKNYDDINEDLFIDFNIGINNKSNYSLFITIKNEKNQPIFSAEQFQLKEQMCLKISGKFLTRGNYTVDTFLHVPRITQIDRLDDICSFTIMDKSSALSVHGDYNYGSVFGAYNWILK